MFSTPSPPIDCVHNFILLLLINYVQIMYLQFLCSHWQKFLRDTNKWFPENIVHILPLPTATALGRRFYNNLIWETVQKPSSVPTEVFWAFLNVVVGTHWLVLCFRAFIVSTKKLSYQKPPQTDGQKNYGGISREINMLPAYCTEHRVCPHVVWCRLIMHHFFDPQPPKFIYFDAATLNNFTRNARIRYMILLVWC